MLISPSDKNVHLESPACHIEIWQPQQFLHQYCKTATFKTGTKNSINWEQFQMRCP